MPPPLGLPCFDIRRAGLRGLCRTLRIYKTRAPSALRTKQTQEAAQHPPGQGSRRAPAPKGSKTGTQKWCYLVWLSEGHGLPREIWSKVEPSLRAPASGTTLSDPKSAASKSLRPSQQTRNLLATATSLDEQIVQRSHNEHLAAMSSNVRECARASLLQDQCSVHGKWRFCWQRPLPIALETARGSWPLGRLWACSSSEHLSESSMNPPERNSGRDTIPKQ